MYFGSHLGEVVILRVGPENPICVFAIFRCRRWTKKSNMLMCYVFCLVLLSTLDEDISDAYIF